MKKLFISMLAVAAVTACAKDEAISLNQEAIGFGDAFIENSTRAIYASANNITGFKVFGQVAEDVALYGETGANVTRNSKNLGVAWDCDVTRFWTPESTFKFAAIANGTAKTVEKGLPTVISYTVQNDPADLIYATATAVTNESSVPTGDITADTKVVKFNFQHLLSRVEVGFVNLIPEEEYTYKISDVKITTWQNGEYTIGEEPTPWARVGNNTADLTYIGIPSLDNSATATPVGEQLVIPGSTVNLSFTYELCLNGTTIYTKPVTKNAVVTPVQNYSYNITVQLKAGNKIDFTVATSDSLAGWTTQPEDLIQ